MLTECLNELCETGQDLWESYRSTSEENLYNDYVNHIKSCSECIQKLGLTREDIEILNEDDLEPFDRYMEMVESQ